jgi:hypothetical protein
MLQVAATRPPGEGHPLSPLGFDLFLPARAAVKSATVYLTDNDWIITSMSRTTAGVWVANFLVHRLANDCPDEELGEGVLQSLEASETGVPHPTNWPDFHRRYVASLGVPSYSKFVAKCRSLSVKLGGGTVTLTPYRNRGLRHGFEPLSNKIEIQPIEPQPLGRAVRECSRRCR